MLRTSLLFILFLLWSNLALAKSIDPIIINATVTATHIEFSPNTIPDNTPFVIHIINESGVPIELENSDTSVEIYANMDKTFKVGLAEGNYVFFNDFNTHTKKGILKVKPAAALSKVNTSQTEQTHLAPSKQNSNFNASEILFIIWRESVEALLVVGVVYSWLTQVKKGRRSGFLFLWMGVGIGLLCAILLSFLLIKVNHVLLPDSANLFQAGMTFIAAIMIIYMVKWMRENGRSLKKNMCQSLEKNSSNRWRDISILIVVAVAIAREASEASIFIYALGFQTSGASSFKMLGILGLGVLLAIGTIYLLQLGNKIFSWRFFFKVTEILLLLLGGGLLLNCIDRLIISGVLTPILTKVWDTSFLISDGGFFAPMLASFMGYRATPSLIVVMTYCAYWVAIYFLLKPKKRPFHAA
jgi:high-affinity iron transporter